MDTASEISKVASAILTSIGGASVIILGLSSWFGKVWANKILEKEKAAYSKEIEHYKSELNRELGRIGAIQDKALYISKAQYDNEYKIYQEIWEKMHECVALTKALYPISENVPSEEEKYNEYQVGKYEKFSRAYNEYLKTIEKHAPFYKKEFYDKFMEIREKCISIGIQFKMYEIDVKYSVTFAMVRDKAIPFAERNKCSSTIPKEIDKISDKLKTEIREYLLSLRLE
jgi:cell division protein FtsB